MSLEDKLKGAKLLGIGAGLAAFSTATVVYFGLAAYDAIKGDLGNASNYLIYGLITAGVADVFSYLADKSLKD